MDTSVTHPIIYHFLVRVSTSLRRVPTATNLHPPRTAHVPPCWSRRRQPRRAARRGRRGLPGAGRVGPGAGARGRSSPITRTWPTSFARRSTAWPWSRGSSARGRRAGGSGRVGWRPGYRVAGYRIVRELGRGGMGVVYEAVHVDLDRPVALKVLGGHAAPGSPGRRRFLNEAKTAAGLHHTHIVPVFDVGQVGGLCYYAMQRIEGSGLDRVAPRPSARPPDGLRLPQRPDADRLRRALRRRRPGLGPPLAVGPDRRASTAHLAAVGHACRRLRPSDRTPALRAAARVPTITAGSPGSASRPPRPWPMPTAAGSSTATSSPRTCWSTPEGSSGSPTSASPDAWKTPARPEATAPWAPRAT